MAYEAEITRASPGCFLFLIDQSGSMAEEIADKPGGKTKAQGVADAINDLLNDLVTKCTRPDGVRDYFEVGVIGYGDKVAPAFAGVLANRDLVPLSEVAKYPIGGTSKERSKTPTWFGPVAKGDTAMCGAFKRAEGVLADWVRKHPDAYPPIVINITDGDAKDGNPSEPAQRVASLRTKDGNVLVFNCHISSEKAKPILFPRDDKELPGFAPRLYRMSSVLPRKFREAAQSFGCDVACDVVDDTRGFAFNADLRDLVRFLDVGKHALIAQLAAVDTSPVPAFATSPASAYKPDQTQHSFVAPAAAKDRIPVSVAAAGSGEARKAIPAEAAAERTPTTVTVVGPAEAYNPIQTQHTFVAQLKDGDGSAVSGARVEWILNRSPGAVGDIVCLGGIDPQKLDNTYGVVKTDSKGQATITLTSASSHEGDTDVTVFVPGIKDTAAHKRFVVKHWLDITARFPKNAENPTGTKHLMIVQTVKVSDGTPVGNVPVRWTIVGNNPAAAFAEAVSKPTTYTVNTDPYGFAHVTLMQVSPAQGTNTVKIEVLAPPNPEFVLLSKEVTKTWHATKLGLTKIGPAETAILGKTTYDIKLQNTGDLTATGVVLTDEIPAGMRYVSSDPAGAVSGSTLRWDVGALKTGETRSFKVVTQGAQAGLWTNRAQVSSKELGTAQAAAVTRVLPAPEVAITKTGPAGVFTGFTRSYTITAINTGAVALNDVVVTDYIPELLSYKSAIPTAGAVTGNQMSWNLGTLNVGEKKEIVTILGGLKSGRAVNKAAVTTREGVSATANLNITVLGAPGAHMSLSESSDPVALGDEVTYTMKVSNQSSSNELHHMLVVGLIPGETAYVSAEGPTKFTVVGKEVRFAAVATMKPGETIEFRIKLKAIAAGAAVFNATMRWDEFGEPIVNQEGTTIFNPQAAK